MGVTAAMDAALEARAHASLETPKGPRGLEPEVSTCFARSMAQALGKPLIAVDHLKAHVLAHFIQDGDPRPVPSFPFINLPVSGGHTQLILVRDPSRLEIIGTTLDDAAGEAFDKGAKVLCLPYPGGPEVERAAIGGDPKRYALPAPAVQGLDMSFSGINSLRPDRSQRRGC